MTASWGRGTAPGICRTNISRKQASANGKRGHAAFIERGKTNIGLLHGLRAPQDFDAELAAIEGVELWDDLPSIPIGDDQ